MFLKISTKKQFTLLIAAFSFFALQAAADSETKYIKYKDRTIDVSSYVEGFPFKTIIISPENGQVYYLKKGNQELLYRADLGDKIDLTKGTKISDINFAARSYWDLVVNEYNGKTYIRGDEDNTEVINLFELDEKTGLVKKITNVEYIYDFSFSPDQRYIAYTIRSGKQEFTPGSIHIYDVETGQDRVVYNDSAEYRLTWGDILWTADQKTIYLNVACQQKREYQTIMKVALDGSSQAAPLFACDKKRSITVGTKFISPTQIIYSSDESGNLAVYSYDFAAAEGRKVRTLTNTKTNIAGYQLVQQTDGAVRLVTIETKPVTSVMQITDPVSGQVIERKEFDSSFSFLKVYKNKIYLSRGSVTVPAEWLSFEIEKGFSSLKPLLGYSKELLRKIENCNVQKVSFKTFDGINAPGQKDGLHAFLYTPKKPAKGKDARLLVEAFYGGTNYFSGKINMFCDAGFYVLSPAPRGSWEWGKEFHDLMKGDLGGGEILDVMWAAESVAKKLKIPAKQVGAFGGSHGGYAALRLLTFSGEINGIKSDFKWGFGISDYGISQLLRYYKNTNIPAWVTGMTGEDPNLNPGKWLERSPELGARYAHGPIFLAHGSNDKRVGVEESQMMYQALREFDKPATYLELPGQGHGFKGVDTMVKYYQEMFKFLETIKN